MKMNKKGQVHGNVIGGVWTIIYLVILLAVGGLVTAYLVRFMAQQQALMTPNSSEANLTQTAIDASATTFGYAITIIGVAVVIIIIGMFLMLLGVFGKGTR